MNFFSKYKDLPISVLWASLFAILLAIGWLLPNHSLPWTAFHSDAWVAVILGLAGGVALVCTLPKVSLHVSNLVTMLAATIPIAQFLSSQLPFLGLAVMSSLYILGFALAQFAGQQWQIWRPAMFGNILFGALGFASVVSVVIQFYQWTGQASDSGMMDIWVLGFDGARPYANLGQPNQLSTLLLWGLLACGWVASRKNFSQWFVGFIAAFILIGLALAQSRSSMIGLLFMLIAGFFWKPFGKTIRIRCAVVIAGLFYVICLAGIPVVGRTLLLSQNSTVQGRSENELRPAAWRMFLDAVSERPWLGYGWDQVMSAHAAVGHRHPVVGHLFGQTHNLFLDFLVWVGIPIGVALSVSLMTWFLYAARRVVSAEDGIYFLMMVVVGVHAMVELPLHYAYLLLPTGLVLGVLNKRLNIAPVSASLKMSALFVCVVYVIGLVTLGFVIRDYFIVEQATEIVRFEKAHVRVKEPAKPPNILLLTQLREQISFFILEPVKGLAFVDLQRAHDIVTTYPSRYNIMKMITLLVLNDQFLEARKMMCSAPFVMDKQARKLLQAEWSGLQAQYSELASTPWIGDAACNMLVLK